MNTAANLGGRFLKKKKNVVQLKKRTMQELKIRHDMRISNSAKQLKPEHDGSLVNRCPTSVPVAARYFAWQILKLCEGMTRDRIQRVQWHHRPTFIWVSGMTGSILCTRIGP